jgi:hypothetical protein
MIKTQSVIEHHRLFDHTKLEYGQNCRRKEEIEFLQAEAVRIARDMIQTNPRS